MSEIYTRGESGFVFFDKDAVLAPDQTDRFLRDLHNEVGMCQLALRRARTAELNAFQTYITARKPYELDDDFPTVGRGAGQVSAKEQELWFEARVPDQFWAWKHAVLARQNAADYMWQVKKQTEIMQSINANCRLHYASFRGDGR